MWEYSEKVMEHYRNPHNAGVMENPSAVGETGSIACGDALKLYLKIDQNGIITDAKFQTFGCGSAVASSSILTDMVIGKTVDEAQKITNEDIVKALGGLPAEKIHCSVMGQEALEAAINNYLGIEEDHSHEKIVCRCFNVSEEKLIQQIKEHNIKTVQEATNYCKVAGSCGRCAPEVQHIIDKVNALNEAPKKPMTKTQMIVQISKVLDNYVSDELRKDGGDIELIDVEDNKVYVKLQGSCSACPSSHLTLKNFVENVLREHISKDIEVVEYKD